MAGAVDIEASACADVTVGVVVRAELGFNAEGLEGLPDKGGDGRGNGGGVAAMKTHPV